MRIGVAAAIVLSGCLSDGTGVRPDEPGKLVLEPSAIDVRTHQRFVVRASLPSGSPLLDSVTWATSDPRVASFDGDSILPRAAGTATLTATAGDRTGTVTVTVIPDVALGGFQSPFTGDYPTWNVLDHDLPRPFNPAFANGYQLTYWGEKIVLGYDGHAGHDFALPPGTPVYSAAAGTVVTAGQQPVVNCPLLPGNPAVSSISVTIAHAVSPNEYIRTNYAHFTSITVRVGDRIPAHHLIGYSGNTGCSTGPHLHFGVLRMRGTESRARAPGDISVHIMDPYGWSGPGTDPWAADTGGIESIRIWSAANAPRLYGPGRIGMTNAKVSAYYVRLWGEDGDSPNEIVELSSNGDGADLTGWSIRNAAGDRFSFPAGAGIAPGSFGYVRVISGVGTDAGQTFFWGRTSRAWNTLGDCLQIFDAAGNRVSAQSLMSNKCAELGL